MVTERESYERFARDIEKHELTVLRNDGVYRHIRCAKPGSFDMSFEIVTWSGYLAYVGDMGAYTFQRTEDMFGFFRREDGKINPGYWAEKVEARDRDGVKEWEQEKFREAVLSDARAHLDLEDDAELPPDALEELEPLLSAEDEYEAVAAIRYFDSEMFGFTDFFEHDCTEYTTRFLWCLHAIVWAVNKFDAMTEAKS